MFALVAVQPVTRSFFVVVPFLSSSAMFCRRVASSARIPAMMYRALHISSQRQAMRILPPLVVVPAVARSLVPSGALMLTSLGLQPLSDNLLSQWGALNPEDLFEVLQSTSRGMMELRVGSGMWCVNSICPYVRTIMKTSWKAAIPAVTSTVSISSYLGAGRSCVLSRHMDHGLGAK